MIAFHEPVRIAVLALVAGCGRISFDPLTDGAPGGDDGPGVDGSGAACMGLGNPTCGTGGASINGMYTTSNTTVDLANTLAGSCGGADGNELAVQLTVLVAGTYEFSSEFSAFDSVIYVLDTDCGGSEMFCSQIPNQNESFSMSLSQGRQIVVVVDGASANECGTVNLTVTRL